MSHPDGRRPADEAGLQGQTEQQSTVIVGQSDDKRKALATIQAEAALRGVEMLQLPDGRLVASRDGNWFKVLRNEADLSHVMGRGWLV